MNYKLSFILITCATFSNAQTVHIQSTATPEGISLEKYNQLTTFMNQSNEAHPTLKAKHEAAKQKTSNLSQAAVAAKAEAAAKAKEEAANKKAEARKIASSSKRDFESKIINAWKMPAGFTGKKATARITLSNNGDVLSIIVTTTEPQLRASIEQAVREAAPYPMPSDPDARSQARSFTASFTVK